MSCLPETIKPKELAAVGQRIHEMLTGGRDISTLSDDDKIGIDNLLAVIQNVDKLIDKKGLTPEEQILLNKAIDDVRTTEGRRLIGQVRQQLINEKAVEPKFLDKVAEWTASMYLWRLASAGTAMVSNLGRNLVQYPELKMAAWFNKGIARRNNVPLSRFPEEAGLDFKAAWMSGEFKKSFAEAMKIMKEDPEAVKGSVFFQREHARHRAIKGTKGKVIRAGLNAQGAIDVLYRLPAAKGDIAVLAWRKAMRESKDRIEALQILNDTVANVERVVELKKAGEEIPEEFEEYETMLTEAEKMSEKTTFQEELQGIARHLSETRRHPLARIFVPFLNTRMNILKQAFERSPLAIFHPEMLDLIKRSFHKELSAVEAGEFADRTAQIAMGTAVFLGVLAALATMWDDWEITGDYDEKTIVDKPKGWQNNSIRFGNTYISYRYFEPFATIFSFWGNLHDSPETQKMIESKKISDKLLHGLEASISSLGKVVMSNPLADEVFDIVGAVKDGKTVQFFTKMVAGMALPGIVQDVGKIIDPIIREKKDLTDIGLSQTGLPGKIIGLPPKVDVFGENIQPQTREEKVLKAATGLAISTNKEDPVRRELRKLGLRFSVRTYTHKGVVLTPSETLRLNRFVGIQFKKQIETMMRNPTYQAKSRDEKRKSIKSVRVELLNLYKKGIETSPAFEMRRRAKEAAQ